MMPDDDTVGDLVAAFLIQHDAFESLATAATRDAQPWALRTFSVAHFSACIQRGEFALLSTRWLALCPVSSVRLALDR